MAVEIRRGTDRFMDRVAGRRTAHAFSFGTHYDPERVRFGPMVCHDDHLLRVGEGFEEHEHSEQTILTWVVSGAVRHTDESGSVELYADQGAILHAVGALRHSEMAAAPQTRFIQVWLTPPTHGAGAGESTRQPSYHVLTPALAAGLNPIVEPQPGAAFSLVRLGADETVTIPAAPLVHVFVTRGALLRSSLAQPLHVGDAFLFTDEPSYDLTAGVPTDLLLWSFSDS